MAVNKLDPKVIFASEAPAQDTPAVFTNRTVGWGETRKNGGRPTIKQMNAEQQSTDLKILWLNENAITPFDPTIDYPTNAVTIKDGAFKIFNGSVWNIFLTKASVGLGDVDNTSDLSKPISTATQSALNDKASVVSLVNLRTSIDLKADLDVVKRGIGNIYDPTLTYNENERVILLKGDVVKSTVSNNTNNPNTDMTGWVDAGNIGEVNSIAELLAIQNPKAGDVVFVKGHHPATNFAVSKPYKGGGFRVYVPSLSSRNDDGVCIDGWVLSDTTNLNVYHFGAYGDWNATAQTGHDDTEAFQNYANYLINYENNPREGGTRIMRVLAGNYRLDGFTITQGSAYWSFNLVGEGQLSQLWFNPNGQGIILEQENTVFQDIFINGKLSAIYPSAQDPAIPSIVTAKLANKLLDVDFTAKNVNVSWFNTFATISGRGFTFINGSVGMGQTLFKINLTNDLIVAGSEPRIHSVSTSLRHYNVSNCRFDVVDRIFDIVGDSDSPLKNYINGVIIANNELTLAAQMGRSTLAGSRLVSPSFVNNLCLGCFGGQTVHSYGAIKDGLDSGNEYYNFIDGAVAEADCIERLYRAEIIDGLTITGTKAKDIRNTLVHGATSINNLKINNCTFENIFDAPTGLKSLIYSSNTPTNLRICSNTLKSVGTVEKRYVVSDFANLQNSTSIVVKDNEASTGFVDQSQNPTLSVAINGVAVPIADYATRKCNFTVDGSYIRMTFSLNIQNITATSGSIRILLPVPAIPDNVGLSTYYSGGGFVGQAAGLVGANNIQLQVSANTDQCIKLMSGNSEFNLSAKTSNTLSLAGVVTYRFK